MSDVELDLDDDNYFGDYLNKSWSKQDETRNEDNDDEFPIEVQGTQVAREEQGVDKGLRRPNDGRATGNA